MSELPSLDELRQGGKRLLSRTLTQIEVRSGQAEVAAFLDNAAQIHGGHVLGLTGPPGVGKSTLTDAMIRFWRRAGKSVAVLAIDPSSSISGGALLGDRTRLQTDPDDQKTFVRSMAARDRLGGLSDQAMAAIALLRAVTDKVIVESVGIGQSESDLGQACDTLALCIQPGSGDSLQFMKAGIMELPDVAVVTKADMGAIARRAASDVAGALSLSRRETGEWKVPVCLLSSTSCEGLEEFVDLVEAHEKHLELHSLLQTKRELQHRYWISDMISQRFGSYGLERAQSWLEDTETGQRPFSSFHAFVEDFTRHRT